MKTQLNIDWILKREKCYPTNQIWFFSHLIPIYYPSKLFMLYLLIYNAYTYPIWRAFSFPFVYTKKNYLRHINTSSYSIYVEAAKLS